MIDDEETTNQEYDDEETDGSDIDNRRNNLNEHNQATTRNMARNASKSISKNIGVTIKNIGANVSKVIITLLKNPYVLLAVAIIIVSVAAYFILKDLFSNNSTKSTSKTISEIVGSKDADPQTKSLVNTYELNRSLLTASIKDVNLIYNNYIKELNESDPVNSLKDMTTMYGDDEVKIEEMKFESDPKEYEKPLEERKSYKNSTNSKVTSYSSSADVGDFVNVAKEIWQKVYSEKYSYSFQASPPYNNGLIDCSAYVSWVLSEAGYDVGRLNTEGLKNYDWSKFGFEVIEVSQNENVIDKLQPGDILVRSDGGGGYGHTNITVNVENGTVWAYDCGNSSNWLNSGGEPYNATGFASGSGGGSNTRAGVIIRVGNSTSTSSSSSSKNKVSNSSKVNSSATTDKYPKDSTYVLPSQKRELYKHMLMTEKYNFNMITWKLYKAEGKGASRTLPSEPSDDIEYTVEPALGLRVPKSDEKTVNYFVQLVEPYLQSSLFPISMYSMSVTSEGNITKEMQNLLIL